MNTSDHASGASPSLILHKPDGPPLGPVADSALLLLRAEQFAVADVAAGSIDAETVLQLTDDFLAQQRLETELRRVTAQAKGHRAEASMTGLALLELIESGRSLADGDEAGATEDSSPDTELLRERVATAKEIESTSSELKKEQAYLDGTETDETGAVLAASLPKTTIGRYRLTKLFSEAFMTPLEVVFGFFVYSLTVNAQEGDGQEVFQALETLSVVALAVITQLMLPILLARATAMLHRHSAADDTRASKVERRAIAIGLSALFALLVILTGWLRASYLSSMIDADAALPISFGWFFAFSVLLLVGPAAIVFMTIRVNSHWNPHIKQALILQAQLAEKTSRLGVLDAALVRRARALERQELTNEYTLLQWDDAIVESLPAAYEEARVVYLDVLVRAKGEPQFTDAVAVVTADAVASRQRVQQRASDDLAVGLQAGREREATDRIARREARQRALVSAGLVDDPSAGQPESGVGHDREEVRLR